MKVEKIQAIIFDELGGGWFEKIGAIVCPSNRDYDPSWWELWGITVDKNGTPYSVRPWGVDPRDLLRWAKLIRRHRGVNTRKAIKKIKKLI